MRAVLRRVRRNWVLEVALTVAFALLLFMAVQAYAVKPYRIPSASMEPTLRVGDRVLVNRFSHHLGAEPEVGQVVVFHPPRGADIAAPECGRRVSGGPCSRPVGPASSDTFVKRVVGVAGDRIAVRDGHVIRNGTRQREPFAAPCGGARECNLPRPVTFQAGYVFVMGDNRGASSDSRDWGPVPIDWVIGEAVTVYWPPGRAGTL